MAVGWSLEPVSHGMASEMGRARVLIRPGSRSVGSVPGLSFGGLVCGFARISAGPAGGSAILGELASNSQDSGFGEGRAGCQAPCPALPCPIWAN